MFILHHGNPAAARGNNHITFANHVSDDFRFDDPDRLRGWHDAPPTAAGVLNHRPFFDPHAVFGLFLLVELPDGLGRVLEGGVILVHQRLRHNRGDRLFPVAPAEFILQRLLDLVTNGSLRVRTDGIQRNLMQEPA